MNMSQKIKFGIAGVVAGMATSFAFADTSLDVERSESYRSIVKKFLLKQIIVHHFWVVLMAL